MNSAIQQKMKRQTHQSDVHIQGSALPLNALIPDVVGWPQKYPDLIQVYRYNMSLAVQTHFPECKLPTRAIHFMWRRDAIRLMRFAFENYQKLAKIPRASIDYGRIISSKFRKAQTRPNGVLVQQILKNYGATSSRDQAACYVLYYIEQPSRNADYISINGVLPLLLSKEQKGIETCFF